MKYLFVELETNLEGKIVPGVYTFDTQEEAMARYHRSLGNHLANAAGYNAILCVVMREDGYIVAEQRYVFEHAEPEQDGEV